MLGFNNRAGGVYGGTWDGGRRSDSAVLQSSGAPVTLASLTVRGSAHHGIAGYRSASLTLSDVNVVGSSADGVHVDQGSRLTASRLSSVRNRINGVQVSGGSTAQIAGSRLNENGQAVSGSTTGKSGHGLGIAHSSVQVSGSDLSSNRVCGMSLASGARAEVTTSSLNDNGRHGVGTVAGVRLTLTDTVLLGNHYNGILATGSQTKAVIAGVTVRDSAQYGISVPEKASVTLSTTTIARSKKINLAASKAARVELGAGNTITSSRGTHGIAIAGKARLSVTGTGNMISSNAGNGILVSDRSSYADIAQPIAVTNNRQNGLYVRNHARARLVTSNFSGNTGKAVRTAGGAKVYRVR